MPPRLRSKARQGKARHGAKRGCVRHDVLGLHKHSSWGYLATVSGSAAGSSTPGRLWRMLTSAATASTESAQAIRVRVHPRARLPVQFRVAVAKAYHTAGIPKVDKVCAHAGAPPIGPRAVEMQLKRPLTEATRRGRWDGIRRAGTADTHPLHQVLPAPAIVAEPPQLRLPRWNFIFLAGSCAFHK